MVTRASWWTRGWWPWAVYQGDRWDDRDADGVELAPSVRLITTPGHSHEDITTIVGTRDGVVACTHAWWADGGPRDDPRAVDPVALDRSRRRVLAVADIIVPGHGPAYRA